MYTEDFVFPLSEIGLKDMSIKEYSRFVGRASTKQIISLFKHKNDLDDIGKFINEGSFGRVFQYKSSKSNKIIKIMEYHSRKDLKNILNEIVIQKILHFLTKNSDPKKMAQIPEVFEVGKIMSTSDTWLFYIVMEKLDITLAEYASKKLKRITKKQVRQVGDILYKLTNLLDFLQSIKFIHGDLKTNNIMLTKKTGQLYVIDFGFSQLQIGKTKIVTEKVYNGTYAPGRDIFMFMYWFYGDLCNMTFVPLLMSDGCKNIPEILRKTLLNILHESNVDLRKFQKRIYQDENNWRRLYRILSREKCVGPLSAKFAKGLAIQLIQ